MVDEVQDRKREEVDLWAHGKKINSTQLNWVNVKPLAHVVLHKQPLNVCIEFFSFYSLVLGHAAAFTGNLIFTGTSFLLTHPPQACTPPPFHHAFPGLFLLPVNKCFFVEVTFQGRLSHSCHFAVSLQAKY